jgi:hypothetical protein
MDDSGCIKLDLLESWLLDGSSSTKKKPLTLDLEHHLNQNGGVSTPDLGLHDSNILSVVLSQSPNGSTFDLPKAQLEFWSPFLRKLIAAEAPQKVLAGSVFGGSISLHNVEKDVFQIFVNFMETRHFAPRPDMTYSTPGDEVPMMIKVWVLANRLKGPTLALRDQILYVIYYVYAVRRLCASYTRFGVPVQLVPFPPAVVRYVLLHTMTEANHPQLNPRVCLTTPLMRFLLAILARPDLEISADKIPLWKELMREIPDFGREVERRLACSDKERMDALQGSTKYMSSLGEVDPGWYDRAGRSTGPHDGLD